MQTNPRFLPPGLAASLSGAIADDARDTHHRGGHVGVRRSRRRAAVVRRGRPGDARLRARGGGQQACRPGETFYTWQRGLPELRAALAAYTERLYGIDCGPERISVTTGGMQAILLSCQLLLDPGDNIVIVSPIWPNITSAARLVRGEPKYVALDRKPDGVLAARPAEGVRRGRRPHAGDLRQLAGQSDRLGDDVGRAARVARFRPQARRLDHGRRGLCPADLRRTRVAPSFLEHATADDALLVLNSFSKPWAMTGWRIGWLTHPPALGDQLAKLVQINTSGVAGLPAARRDRGDREGRGLHQADGRALPRRPRAGVPAPVGQCRASPSRGRRRPFTTSSRSMASPTPWPSARSWRSEYKVGLAPGEAFGRGRAGQHPSAASPRVQSD